jgi:organic hydroperoxide reductase OsmC/OhrA
VCEELPRVWKFFPVGRATIWWLGVDPLLLDGSERAYAMTGGVTMVEIGWDCNGAASCRLKSGEQVRVGSDDGWRGEDLLAAAVATSVMETFLAAAFDARIAVLGYTGSAELVATDGAKPQVALHAAITVAAGVAGNVIAALSRHARRTAPVPRMLATTLSVSSDVEVMSAALR